MARVGQRADMEGCGLEMLSAVRDGLSGRGCRMRFSHGNSIGESDRMLCMRTRAKQVFRWSVGRVRSRVAKRVCAGGVAWCGGGVDGKRRDPHSRPAQVVFTAIFGGGPPKLTVAGCQLAAWVAQQASLPMLSAVGAHLLAGMMKVLPPDPCCRPCEARGGGEDERVERRREERRQRCGAQLYIRPLRCCEQKAWASCGPSRTRPSRCARLRTPPSPTSSSGCQQWRRRMRSCQPTSSKPLLSSRWPCLEWSSLVLLPSKIDYLLCLL